MWDKFDICRGELGGGGICPPWYITEGLLSFHANFMGCKCPGEGGGGLCSTLLFFIQVLAHKQALCIKGTFQMPLFFFIDIFFLLKCCI